VVILWDIDRDAQGGLGLGLEYFHPTRGVVADVIKLRCEPVCLSATVHQTMAGEDATLGSVETEVAG
jgi:hypothetical protein